jgi:hypothetical protein
VAIIPFIPLLNWLIKSKEHTFLVPEAVWLMDHSPNVLIELCEGILALMNLNLILWLVDPKEVLYKKVCIYVNLGWGHKSIDQPI